MSLRLLYLIFVRLCGWLVLAGQAIDVTARIERRQALGGLISEYRRAA